jgi:hypothetical protein
MNHHAAAITRFGVAAASATVREVNQYLETLPHNAVRPVPVNMAGKADAASIVLKARIIEPALRNGPCGQGTTLRLV